MYYLLIHSYKYNYYELVTKINISTFVSTLDDRLLNYSYFISEKKLGPREDKQIAHPHPARKRRGFKL